MSSQLKVVLSMDNVAIPDDMRLKAYVGDVHNWRKVRMRKFECWVCKPDVGTFVRTYCGTNPKDWQDFVAAKSVILKGLDECLEHLSQGWCCPRWTEHLRTNFRMIYDILLECWGKVTTHNDYVIWTSAGFSIINAKDLKYFCGSDLGELQNIGRTWVKAKLRTIPPNTENLYACLVPYELKSRFVVRGKTLSLNRGYANYGDVLITAPRQDTDGYNTIFVADSTIMTNIEFASKFISTPFSGRVMITPALLKPCKLYETDITFKELVDDFKKIYNDDFNIRATNNNGLGTVSVTPKSEDSARYYAKTVTIMSTADMLSGGVRIVSRDDKMKTMPAQAYGNGVYTLPNGVVTPAEAILHQRSELYDTMVGYRKRNMAVRLLQSNNTTEFNKELNAIRDNSMYKVNGRSKYGLHETNAQLLVFQHNDIYPQGLLSDPISPCFYLGAYDYQNDGKLMGIMRLRNVTDFNKGCGAFFAVDEIYMHKDCDKPACVQAFVHEAIRFVWSCAVEHGIDSPKVPVQKAYIGFGIERTNRNMNRNLDLLVNVGLVFVPTLPDDNVILHNVDERGRIMCHNMIDNYRWAIFCSKNQKAAFGNLVKSGTEYFYSKFLRSVYN